MKEIPASFTDEKKDAGLDVTWIGHSTVLIQIDGFTVLTDPNFNTRTFPVVGPKRFHESLPVLPERLPEIDVAIISHNHYDHLDKQSVKALIPKVKYFLVPLKVGEKLLKWGVAAQNITELDWWDSVETLPGLTITATPSRHFSGRGIGDSNETLWASWVIKSQNHSVFFSGDSGYSSAFKKIGEAFGPFDITLIECGAYSRFWSDIHMMPEESVQAHQDLKGIVMIPIHWSTFNLAIHDWFEPIERALAESRRKGVTLATPMAGETITYGKQLPQTAWWRQLIKRDASSSVAAKFVNKQNSRRCFLNTEC